jgi:hypothetical protein
MHQADGQPPQVVPGDRKRLLSVLLYMFSKVKYQLKDIWKVTKD